MTTSLITEFEKGGLADGNHRNSEEKIVVTNLSLSIDRHSCRFVNGR